MWPDSSCAVPDTALRTRTRAGLESVPRIPAARCGPGWDVLVVGMFGRWDVWVLGCLGAGVFGRWGVWVPGCLAKK